MFKISNKYECLDEEEIMEKCQCANKTCIDSFWHKKSKENVNKVTERKCNRSVTPCSQSWLQCSLKNNWIQPCHHWPRLCETWCHYKKCVISITNKTITELNDFARNEAEECLKQLSSFIKNNKCENKNVIVATIQHRLDLINKCQIIKLLYANFSNCSILELDQ